MINSKINKQNKSNSNHFHAELQKVYDSFYSQPKTMRQVEEETGVRRDHITRYVDVLRKINKIKVVRKGMCPITKMNGVQFLSTNPKVLPEKTKLQSLFN